MGIESQASAVILVPLFGSLLIPLIGWAGQRKATGWLAVLIIGATHLLTWPLLRPALSGRVGELSFPLYRFVAFSMNIDALAVFMAFTASLIATLIAI